MFLPVLNDEKEENYKGKWNNRLMLICKCLAANKTFLLLPQTHKNKKNLKEYAMTFSKRERENEREGWKKENNKTIKWFNFF